VGGDGSNGYYMGGFGERLAVEEMGIWVVVGRRRGLLASLEVPLLSLFFPGGGGGTQHEGGSTD
jgi:hypothetical protein